MKREILRSKRMKGVNNLVFGIIILSGFAACKGKIDFSKKKADDEKVIVQYGEHFLTDRDILLVLPSEYTSEDSAKLVKAYVEEWVKKKAIVDKAEANIDELTLKEIDNKMVEYRQDLLINAYNNYLIEKNIKDSVSEKEIQDYFEKHKESFPLSKDIVRYRAVIVEKKDEAMAERLFNSGREEDFDELMKLVLVAGTPYQDNDTIWHSTEVLAAQYPQLNQGNNLNQLLNRRRIKMSDDLHVTLIRVLSFKPKGSEAPYEFVKPTIKNLLLNKRKLNLLGDLQNQLYKEAINKNQIKINEN